MCIPLIIFDPDNEALFKQRLIETKRAKVVLYKSDGSKETKQWNASKFSESSGLRNNIFTGYLRKSKREKEGITKAKFTILPREEL